MKTKRYWTEGANFCCGEGEILDDGNFVTNKRKVFGGYHFATKQEAFKHFCYEMDEKIENIKNEVEVLRERL